MADPRDGCPDCGDIDHHGCNRGGAVESYWGGWTRSGELLHYVVDFNIQYGISACGLVLTGGSYRIPPHISSAKCDKCSYRWERGS